MLDGGGTAARGSAVAIEEVKPGATLSIQDPEKDCPAPPDSDIILFSPIPFGVAAMQKISLFIRP